MHPNDLLKPDRFSTAVVLAAAVAVTIILLMIAAVSFRAPGF